MGTSGKLVGWLSWFIGKISEWMDGQMNDWNWKSGGGTGGRRGDGMIVAKEEAGRVDGVTDQLNQPIEQPTR